MKAKKAKSKDVDAHSATFFRIGLIVATLSVIVAFQWNFERDVQPTSTETFSADEDEDYVDITAHQKSLPQPPEPSHKVEPTPEPIQKDEPEPKPEQDEPDIDLGDVGDWIGDGDEPEAADPLDNVIIIAEKRPEFPGGDAQMMQFIQKQVRYPKHERKMGIEGKVVVGFIVNQDGSISGIEVIQSTTDEFAAEALRIVKAMPAWQPGEHRGKPVRVRVNLPIVFKLKN